MANGIVGRAEPVGGAGRRRRRRGRRAGADPRFAAADEALERGDFAAAEAEFDKLLQANPADAEAKAGKAQAGLLPGPAASTRRWCWRPPRTDDASGPSWTPPTWSWSPVEVEEAFDRLIGQIKTQVGGRAQPGPGPAAGAVRDGRQRRPPGAQGAPRPDDRPVLSRRRDRPSALVRSATVGRREQRGGPGGRDGDGPAGRVLGRRLAPARLPRRPRSAPSELPPPRRLIGRRRRPRRRPRPASPSDGAATLVPGANCLTGTLAPGPLHRPRRQSVDVRHRAGWRRHGRLRQRPLHHGRQGPGADHGRRWPGRRPP